MTITIRIDGEEIRAGAGETVAAAMINSGVGGFRRSRLGEPRFPVCGIGTCFECRLRIDGAAGRRSCLVIVEDGMTVETDEQN